MSNAFDSIKKGLEEAVEYSKGDLPTAKTFIPKQIDVKDVRHKANMTQESFAAAFGISLGTLRHWERGDRQPRGPALVLLNIINKDPKTVLNLLRSETLAL